MPKTTFWQTHKSLASVLFTTCVKPVHQQWLGSGTTMTVMHLGRPTHPQLSTNTVLFRYLYATITSIKNTASQSFRICYFGLIPTVHRPYKYQLLLIKN